MADDDEKPKADGRTEWMTDRVKESWPHLPEAKFSKSWLASEEQQ
jgi:hypothetical protein